jgi:thiosulfate/3-mercaptopyruvate sulfurtransferase
MIYTTLIPTRQVAQHLDDPNWAIFDCRFSLQDAEVGQRSYRQAHIPGAVYAHLDDHLSGTIVAGRTGRHPLPDQADLAHRFADWGIGAGVQVIVYDDTGGAIAARLWWLLRWLGHEAVAVLDGGWPRWQQEGWPTRNGLEDHTARTFASRPRPELVYSAEDVSARLADPALRLVDSRAAERYRGEYEPLDPVAGHIPGALNLPYASNLDQDGRCLPPETLRARFLGVLDHTSPEQVVFYCGSGVTAAHNVLAFLHAGLGEARLYAGSWSEWITDPQRPVARESAERS